MKNGHSLIKDPDKKFIPLPGKITKCKVQLLNHVKSIRFNSDESITVVREMGEEETITDYEKLVELEEAMQGVDMPPETPPGQK